MASVASVMPAGINGLIGSAAAWYETSHGGNEGGLEWFLIGFCSRWVPTGGGSERVRLCVVGTQNPPNKIEGTEDGVDTLGSPDLDWLDGLKIESYLVHASSTQYK